jgi:aminopeptidase
MSRNSAQIGEYARLLVERCLDVQPDWQVTVRSSPLARPLVEEVTRRIARRGAYALVRLSYGLERLSHDLVWAAEAPLELLRTMPPIEMQTFEAESAQISIVAPENTRDGSDLSPERQAALRQGYEPATRRSRALEIPWVICEYPTPAGAQGAGMTLAEYEEFVFGACLLDWDAERRKMERIAERFDGAEEVRIVGEGTDLRLGIGGRKCEIDDGHLNLPGGEVFYGPVEDATEGVITYAEFPAEYQGNQAQGVRLCFESGRVVEASAATGEDFLVSALDTDPGARVLGELGIGCNPAIRQHMRNVLYDEKIYGTVHLALGNSYPFTGGSNVSALHWDMVKDLRNGGQLFCDGELVQENGEWTIA